MVRDWPAVAAAIGARMREREISQRQLAERANVSVATIRELQHNYKPRRRSARTLQAISTALDWPPGRLEDVLQGTAAPGPGECNDVAGSGDASTIAAQLADMRAHLVKSIQILDTLSDRISDERR